jgi:hypothetical protein
LLTVKRICKKYAPCINEFTSTNVNLDENEAIKFYSLDEFDKSLTLNPTTLLEQLTMVFAKSETKFIVNALKFIIMNWNLI